MRRAVTVAVAAVLVVTGCSGPQGSGSSDAGTAAAEASGYPTLGAFDTASEDEDALVDPDAVELVPQWTDQTRESAVATSRAAIEAWARPDLPYDQWWAGLEGYLTPGAREVIALTDPANIPVTTVSEVTLPDEGDTAYVGWVSAQTDDGTWWVLVAWQEDGTWLVDRITASHEVVS